MNIKKNKIWAIGFFPTLRQTFCFKKSSNILFISVSLYCIIHSVIKAPIVFRGVSLAFYSSLFIVISGKINEALYALGYNQIQKQKHKSTQKAINSYN
jgi:hypothetical protein